MPTNPMMMATPESMPDSLVASTSHEPVGIQVSSPIQTQGHRTTLQSVGSPAMGDTRLGQLRSMSSCVPAIQPAGSSDTPPPRTLVLCFDGTGDQFDADNSNIVQLVSLLKKDDKTKQLVYYQVCPIIKGVVYALHESDILIPRLLLEPTPHLKSPHH